MVLPEHRGVRLHRITSSTVAAICLAAAGGGLTAHPAWGDVRLPALVSSGMVLQRDAPLHIWGWADSGETVQIQFRGQDAQTRADRKGYWEVSLGPYPAGGPYGMSVAGKNSILLHDILIGDVWLASGQSNMEFTLGAGGGYPGIGNAEQELADAQFPQMRLFTVEKTVALYPRDDVVSTGWQAVTPDSASRFSAVAYFFGRELYEHYRVPIGLIQSVWGGTFAEAWMSKSALRPYPQITAQADALDEKARLYFETLLPQKRAWYRQHLADDRGRIAGRDVWADPALDTHAWPTLELPRPDTGRRSDFNGFSGIVWLRKEITVPEQIGDCDWVLDLGTRVMRDDSTFWNGRQIGQTQGYGIPRNYIVPKSLVGTGRNVVTVRLKGGTFYDSGFTDQEVGIFGAAESLKIDTCSGTIPLSGTWAYQTGADLRDFPVIDAATKRLHSMFAPPTTLFNGMINALSPYRIKGVIWYQGEANALENRSIQYRTLFPALIEDWRRQWRYDFPFLFVQLAGLDFGSNQTAETSWVELREAQDMALRVPNTGMATAIDIGNAVDIHPRNKKDVGHRLALVAFRVASGKSGVVDSGPRYQSMRIEGQRIRIRFSNLGSGLMIKDEYEHVRGFEIAGADGRFYPARALTDGQDILVFSGSVEKPTAVRYDWSGNPDGNIANREGLPALPFRTDGPLNPVRNEGFRMSTLP